MKITIKNLKPRNPLVAAVKFRKSGKHAHINRRIARSDQQKLEA